MSVFKNEVGRPSNETLRKRRLIIIGSVLGCILLVFLLVSFASKTLTKKEVKNTKKQVHLREKTEEEKATAEYIKDFKATDEFYDKYFADYETMENMNNLDNVLIVMTKYGVENNFGATFIVEAPDYTYFLQYEDEAAKNNAYEGFQKLKEEGKVYEVSENKKIETYGSNYVPMLAINQMASTPDNGGWYRTAMGLDNAYNYMRNISTNIRLAICDKFPYNNSNFDNAYSYFSNRSIKNYKINTIVNDDHGIQVSSTADDALPLAFGISQYNLYYKSEFVNTMDKMWAESGVYAINLSFGYEGYSSVDDAAVGRALNGGVISVAATPDSETSKKVYPAGYTDVIAVSGITQSYQHMWCTGDYVDFVAPSTRVYCSGIDGPGTCDGTSIASPLVASAVAMLKYYDKNISLNNVKKLLSLYARTDLKGYKEGKDGWGHGLVYLGNTKIFEDVINKDYTSGPGQSSYDPTPTTTNTSYENPDNPTFWDTILEILKKIFTIDNLKTVLQWTVKGCEVIKNVSDELGLKEMLLNLINSCANQQVQEVQEQKQYQTTTEKKPSGLVTKGDYYLITNYAKTNNMKKQKDYICDGKSECYANAYFMKLIGKVPSVYYGSCTKGTVKASSCRNANKTSKIEYVCNLICPNPKVSKINVGTAYDNLIKNNKPSILTIKNGNETRNVVIVGITKKAYATYKDSGNSSMSLDGFVVTDPWDGNLKVINKDKISDVSSVTGWELVEVKK